MDIMDHMDVRVRSVHKVHFVHTVHITFYTTYTLNIFRALNQRLPNNLLFSSPSFNKFLVITRKGE